MSYKDFLKDNNLDGYLLSDEANMRYIANFTGEGYVVLTKDRKYVLTDSRYTVQAELEVDEETDVITLKTGENYPVCIKSVIENTKLKRIGFEGLYISYTDLCAIKGELNSLSNCELVDMSDKIDILRLIKSEEELKLLSMAESIGDKAFDYVVKHIKVGMTELEVAAMIEYALKTNGAETTSFNTIVASGINGAKPHAVPSEKKLEDGDLVTMDFGCKYHGYCSDMTRTIAMTSISDEKCKIYETVLKAQLAGLDAIEVGKACNEVDAAARNVIDAAGYGKYFGHGLGHGVGLKIHEAERFSPTCKAIVQKNMIMTVEPGIYVPEIGGVRIEDMVAITGGASRITNLAHSPKELIIIK